jgi:probable HAF family extracellular repeat protein
LLAITTFRLVHSILSGWASFAEAAMKERMVVETGIRARNSLAAGISAIVVCLILAACRLPESESPPVDVTSNPPVVASIELPAAFRLKVGQKFSLQPHLIDSKGLPLEVPAGTIKYAFDQVGVLSITNGQVEAMAPGDAQIIASVGDVSSRAVQVHVVLRLYIVSGLGSLGGDDVQAAAINGLGQVAGTARLANGAARAFVWTPKVPNGTSGDLQDLGVPSGFATSTAAGINDVGQVAGTAYAVTGYSNRAFLWEAGKFNVIDPPPGSPVGLDYTGAAALNARGQVLILSGRPYIWQPGQYKDLAGGAGASAWQVVDLNESGTAVGIRTFGAGAGLQYGWISSDAGFGSLGDLLPAAINDLGEVVGGVQFPHSPDEPVFTGLNNKGQVVGVASSPGSIRRGVLRERGAVYDLNDMLQDGSPGYFEIARDINDAGQIIGQDGPRALLLTPEP